MGKTMRFAGENHINKMVHHMKYRLNETARYHPIVDENDEFDDLPIEIYNTDDGMPVPTSPGLTNEAGEQADAEPIGSKNPLNTDPSTEEPNLNAPPANAPPAEAPMANLNAPPTDVPIAPVAQTPPVDDIQNSIIKHNLAAMEAISNQLSSLNAYVQGLDSKISLLNADVEEVREPTNVEKLMKKTEVSHPYNYNLNDMWSNNWFDEKRRGENERGIRELPDGTFVADFDDLPKQSKIDIEKSFNDLV